MLLMIIECDTNNNEINNKYCYLWCGNEVTNDLWFICEIEIL